MKSLLLSMLSARAIWAAFDASSRKIIAYREWERTQGTELSSSLASELDLFFKSNNLDFSAFGELCVIAGPGSFTGLRVSSSFMQGVSVARDLPLRGLPSFRLYGESFAIPLRAIKAAELGLERYKEEGFKFLEVNGDKDFRISEKTQLTKVLGFGDTVLWPTISALETAMNNSADTQDFEIYYGYEPDFVKGG